MFILITLVCRFLTHEEISAKILIYETTFTRNYFGGFWAHTWSLCVEEHFYFLFSFIIFLICNKTNYIVNIKSINCLFYLSFAISLVLRVTSLYIENHYGSNHFFNSWARYSHTHHRIDSLLFGVFLSYNLSFNRERMKYLFNTFKMQLLVISILLITAVSVFSENDAFKTTVSFTLLYLCFGIILISFIITESLFNNIKTKWLVKAINLIAFIGYNSYAIYLFHPLIRDYIVGSTYFINNTNIYIQFIIYIVMTVLIGFLATKYIEKYFLKLRETYFK